MLCYIDTVICVSYSLMYLLFYNYINVLVTFLKCKELVSSKLIPQRQRWSPLAFSTAL
jgi:hypothetical protein